MSAASSAAVRVPLVERDQVPPEVADLYDRLYADRGVVPNMFKALSNVPPLVLGIAAMLKPLMAEGALTGWYKELLATHVAALNRCEYCVSGASAAGRASRRHARAGGQPGEFRERPLHGEGKGRLPLRRACCTARATPSTTRPTPR